MPFVLKAGSLAYLDTITSGLVPCKVVSVYRAPSGSLMTVVRVTADRRAYSRGETLDISTLRVVPRKAVSFRTAKMGKVLPYSVEIDGSASA